MKIMEYPEVSELLDSNVFLIDGNNGTKKISASALKEYFGGGDITINAEMHRHWFRGKNLGTTVTEEQYAAIESGTFDDLYLGDYWVINDVVWRIVDFDYWMGCGDTACTKHHLVIMPDHALYNAQMNDTNVTTGGYVGSQMYKTNINSAKNTIKAAFGNAHILSNRELLTNAVTNGYPSAGAWCDSDVELPNEIMMYGCYIHTPMGNGSIVPYIYTIDKTQLALMRHDPKWINPYREHQWLRDVVSTSAFAHVGNCGYSGHNGASASYGVRPVFGLVAA